MSDKLSITRTFALRSFRYALRRLGFEVPQRIDKTITPLTALEHPCDAIYHSGDVAFEVPLEKCRYPYHFSYDPAGWHPFVAVLRQYISTLELSYEDSILHEYYKRYQPKNVFEAFFPNVSPDDIEGAHPLTKLSIPPYEPFFPWDASKPHTKAEKGLGASHGNQGFGPVSDEKGRLELTRLKSTYESVKGEGYKPLNGHDGDIRGYFLRTSDDYRFFIRQGLHRAAVLSAMDYKSVRVKFFKPTPRAVFLADSDNWPQVKKGELTPAIAERIFKMFFDENGTQKAQRLGLLAEDAV